jgi:3-oxoacyl-[acyl-carrier protein] reductase
VVVSSTKLADCQKVVEEIKSFGANAIAIQCDVSKSSDVNNMVNETIKVFGKIDILVNNA